MTDKRTFTVVDARGTDGCATKYLTKGNGGYYHGTPDRAAKKAFRQLCKIKKIKGQCAMLVTVREMTQGSDKREHTYKLRRVKLDKPLVLPNGIKIEYNTECEAYKHKMPPCSSGLSKSSGRMRSKHARSSSSHTKKTKKAMKH